MRRREDKAVLLQRWLACVAIAGLLGPLLPANASEQSGAGDTVLLAQATSVASGATAAAAVPAAASEDRVKAASLYKFLNYISWPPAAFVRPDAPYVIGIAGDDEVADNLEQLVVGHKVADRQVVVRRIHGGEQPVGLHVLFVGRADRNRLPQWLRQLQGQPVLVVTEGEGGNAGGMINFRVVDERVRFEVALEPVEKAGLRLDSRMLAVALSVNKGGLQ